MSNTYKFKVATRCMTYNQAPFIEQTLHGFEIQEIPFPVVFIIVDDCSSDGEQDLLRRWAAKNLLMDEKNFAYKKQMPYGEIIHAHHKDKENAAYVFLILNENLVKSGKGFLKTKYISEWNEDAEYNAICEGDDYWIHPRKLVMQVDYLESHSETGLVYTEIDRYLQQENVFEKEFFKTIPVKNTHEDFLLNSWFLSPCTWLYRSELSKLHPLLDRKKCFTGDTLWLLTYSKYSQVHLIDEVTAVYRVLNISASHFADYHRQRQFGRRNLNTRIFFLQDKSLLFRTKFWWNVFMEGRPSFHNQLFRVPEWLSDGLVDFIRILFIKKVAHAFEAK